MSGQRVLWQAGKICCRVCGEQREFCSCPKAKPILGNAQPTCIREIMMVELTLSEISNRLQQDAVKMERVQRKLEELRERLKE